MQIREVMTRDAECTRPGATLQEAAQRMKALDVGSLPICDNDRLVGMITDRDITIRGTAGACDPGTTCVRNVMTPEVTWCFEDQDVNQAVKLMEEKKIRRLVVLSREKKLAGIVSLGDLAVKMHDDRLSGEALEQVSEPAEPRR